jgi:hypothetical protein
MLTMYHLATVGLLTLMADHLATAEFPTVVVYHLATVGLLMSVAGHCATAGFWMLAVNLLATVGFLTLAADHLATAGLLIFVTGHYATARFQTLVTDHLATVEFPMLVADHCLLVAKDTMTRRPNFPASPTQVSRHWLRSMISGVLLQGCDRNTDDGKEKKDSSGSLVPTQFRGIS